MLYDDSDMTSFPVLTPEDTRRTEQKAFDLGVSSLLLMEHAAQAVVDELEKALGGDCQRKRVLFLCGTGNNGGDGLAAARLFKMRGGWPQVWLYGEPKTQDAQTNLQWLRQVMEDDILNLADICVLYDEHGAPYYDLRGHYAELAKSRQINFLFLSITHESGMAAAMCVAERKD